MFFAGHACGLRQRQQQGRRVNLISESTTLKVGYTNLHVGVKAPGTAKMTLRLPPNSCSVVRASVLAGHVSAMRMVSSSPLGSASPTEHFLSSLQP